MQRVARNVGRQVGINLYSCTVHAFVREEKDPFFLFFGGGAWFFGFLGLHSCVNKDIFENCVPNAHTYLH